MTEIKKNSIIKKRSLFNYNQPINNNIIKNVKYSSQNNLSLLPRKDFNLKHSSKKRLNIIDFIKQKNKFFIENSFDVNGTREFLASKEVAMRAIKLNDEIIDVNTNILVTKNNYTNKNLIKLDYNFKEENKRKSMKTAGNNTISPRKSRKSHKIRIDKELILETKVGSPKKSKKSKKSKKISKSSKKIKNKEIKSVNKENSSNLDSDSSNNNKKEKNKHKNKNIFEKGDRDSLSNLYKFFIDNANEPEDNFNKKLKKELKKVEKMNNNINEKVRKKSINKTNINKKKAKRINSVIIQKKRKDQSAFLFSEITKNLMKNDDLSLSSIGNSSMNDLNNNKANKKVVKRKFSSIQINNRKIKEKLQEKMIKDKDNQKNILIVDKNESNSDKESIISILSDLI